jgi:prepilin-type N-terminal cleavage/methylation domain-containing protein
MARTRNRGFTLVELLLVIVIVAVLCAFLFPVLASARKQARMTRCTINLRQLGMALRAYADDYGSLPDPIRLVRSVKERGILFCPDDSGETPGASSYTFRTVLAPDFRPYWDRTELAPNTVVALCNHHLERRVGRKGSTKTVGAARYPIKLVLRWSGGVERVHLKAIRETLVPGDRPTVMRLYPGEEGWEAGTPLMEDDYAGN